jgi:hypothetical protein
MVLRTAFWKASLGRFVIEGSKAVFDLDEIAKLVD